MTRKEWQNWKFEREANLCQQIADLEAEIAEAKKATAACQRLLEQTQAETYEQAKAQWDAYSATYLTKTPRSLDTFDS